MKTEFTDVSETKKTLTVEIPQEVVDAEINRIAQGYTKQARLPGFRPGKVPATIIKQRFRDQILHDVMHGLIPRAVDEALQARGIEPVATPNIRDVALNEGQPLKFTANVETVPPFDPGDLSEISLHQTVAAVDDDAVDQALERLRERAAKYETEEARRPAADGDTLVVDIDRRTAADESDTHENVTLEIGSPANPPGFDAELIGMQTGEEKTFTIHFPDDHAAAELAGSDVTYTARLKEIRRKILPPLDDEFAKDLGEFESLEALRERVRSDLVAEREEAARRQLRADLMKQLAARVRFDVPDVLVEREMDRRLEEFARQLVQQRVDPAESGIDWAQLREAQREASRTSVASALVLDEVARRENLTVAAEDVDKEIEQFAQRAGRTPAAVRAQLEKEGGLGRLSAGLRREKAVDLALSRAKMTDT
ncbi:MAG TPA: trigger factor [Vicinamibacterales bacterium]|nr:trigger factor [Vicinamibacterales bacterium]